jgi:hypothetical protein
MRRHRTQGISASYSSVDITHLVFLRLHGKHAIGSQLNAWQSSRKDDCLTFVGSVVPVHLDYSDSEE